MAAGPMGKICNFNTHDVDQNRGSEYGFERSEYRIKIWDLNIGPEYRLRNTLLALCVWPHFVCFSPDDRVKVESALQILAPNPFLFVLEMLLN